MKTINIYGENKYEQSTKYRETCRGIVLKEDKILLTYEVNTDQWFIPGGGLESGETNRTLTERELKVGLEPRWISLNEAIEIFSKHQDYADVDEMKRGAYLREYQALLSYLDR